MVRAFRPFPGFAGLCCAGLFCATGAFAGGRKDAVTVQGFDGELVNSIPKGNPLMPPVKGPVFYYPVNAYDDGRKELPAAGIVHAVAVYLSKNGFWVARGSPPDVILVIHWHGTDPQITHFGPPAQLVDLGGSGALGLCGEDLETRMPPAVGIVAIDFKAAEERPQRIVRLWEMALWLRVARPTGEVEIGTPEVKQYLDPVPPPPGAAPGPKR